MQELSYTLILIYQHLKQPGSTPKQVQKLSYTLILNYKKLKTAWQHTSRSWATRWFSFTNIWNSLAAHQNKKWVQHSSSWATRWFSFTNTWNSLAAHQNKCKSWATRWFSLQKIKNSLAAHQQELSYTLILIYQHLKQPGSTPKKVQKKQVELHVDSHLPTLELHLAAHQNQTSAGVELHVDSHLPTLETAWQHTKTSAKVELHVDSQLVHKSRSWTTAWQHTSKCRVELHVDSHLNTWNSLAAHQNKCKVELHVDSHLQHLKQPGSTPKQVQELSYTLILI